VEDWTQEGTLVPTQAFVKRHYKSDDDDLAEGNRDDSEVLEIHMFATQPATVKVEMGMTINLGNYESCRISVALTTPCYREEQDAAYVWVKDWVEERTLKEAQEARKFSQSRSSSPSSDSY